MSFMVVAKLSRLQNQTLLALSALSGQEGSPGGRLKHFTDTIVGLCGAFKVLVGTNLLSYFFTLSMCQPPDLD